jgi:hypothetical protein
MAYALNGFLDQKNQGKILAKEHRPGARDQSKS